MTCDSKCPVQGFVALLAGKWALPVLHTLLAANGPLRFGEIRRHVAIVTQKELAKTLRDFELRGLVTRTCFAEVPPRVEYEATPFARTLHAPLDAIESWALTHKTELCEIAARTRAANPKASETVAA